MLDSQHRKETARQEHLSHAAVTGIYGEEKMMKSLSVRYLVPGVSEG